MKINTTIELKQLDGKVLKNEVNEPVKLGKILANIIVSNETGGKMKLYELGTKLYQKDEVEVDSSDLILLKGAVETCKLYNALILGQCALILNELPKVEDKKLSTGNADK